MINRLISNLMVIREFAKDIHYNVSGLSAISLHKYADEVQDGLSDYIDELKEVCLLGNNKRPLSSKEYMQETIKHIPDIPDNDDLKFFTLQSLIAETLVVIEAMNDLSTADANLVGNIAEKLKKSVGLINLIIE